MPRLVGRGTTKHENRTVVRWTPDSIFALKRSAEENKPKGVLGIDVAAIKPVTSKAEFSQPGLAGSGTVRRTQGKGDRFLSEGNAQIASKHINRFCLFVGRQVI